MEEQWASSFHDGDQISLQRYLYKFIVWRKFSKIWNNWNCVMWTFSGYWQGNGNLQKLNQPFSLSLVFKGTKKNILSDTLCQQGYSGTRYSVSTIQLLSIKNIETKSPEVAAYINLYISTSTNINHIVLIIGKMIPKCNKERDFAIAVIGGKLFRGHCRNNPCMMFTIEYLLDLPLDFQFRYFWSMIT